MRSRNTYVIRRRAHFNAQICIMERCFEDTLTLNLTANVQEIELKGQTLALDSSELASRKRRRRRYITQCYVRSQRLERARE